MYNQSMSQHLVRHLKPWGNMESEFHFSWPSRRKPCRVAEWLDRRHFLQGAGGCSTDPGGADLCHLAGFSRMWMDVEKSMVWIHPGIV